MKTISSILFIFISLSGCSQMQPIASDICKITDEICYYAQNICDLYLAVPNNNQIKNELSIELLNKRDTIKQLYIDLDTKKFQNTNDFLSNSDYYLLIILDGLKNLNKKLEYQLR